MQQTATTSEPKALPNAAKFTAAKVQISGANSQFNDTHNHLILYDYFFTMRSKLTGEQGAPGRDVMRSENFPDFAERKMPFAINRLANPGKIRCNNSDRLAQLQAVVDLSLNLTHCGDTNSRCDKMYRDVNIHFEREIQNEIIWFEAAGTSNYGCGGWRWDDGVDIGEPCTVSSPVCRL